MDHRIALFQGRRCEICSEGCGWSGLILRGVKRRGDLTWVFTQLIDKEKKIPDQVTV
jgi:hypothetical protein